MGCNLAACFSIGFNLAACFSMGFNLAACFSMGFNLAPCFSMGFQLAACFSMGFELAACFTYIAWVLIKRVFLPLYSLQLKSVMDLTMMAFNPSHSRLRTQEELYFLLEQSNFGDAQTYATRAGYSIVEAFPTRS